MVDYQNSLIFHSKLEELHLKNLREVFIRCRFFGIYLNPKKHMFVVSKGRLLSNFMRNKWIYIDLERIYEINELKSPVEQK